jgi:hypothetical protein
VDYLGDGAGIVGQQIGFNGRMRGPEISSSVTENRSNG